MGQDQSCWAPPFDEQFCCYNSPSLLSSVELSVLQNSLQADGSSNLDLSCGCRPHRDDAGQTWESYDAARNDRFWCRALKTIGYQHDDTPLLHEFMTLDVNTLAECPIGAAALSYKIGFRKAQMSGANLFDSPAYVYASEIFNFLFNHAKLEDIFSAGWPLFHQMSFIREFYFRNDSNAIASDASLGDEEKKWFSAVEEALTQEGEAVVPIDFKPTVSMYMRDKSSTSGRARAVAALAMAENLLAVDDLDRAEVGEKVINESLKTFLHL